MPFFLRWVCPLALVIEAAVATPRSGMHGLFYRQDTTSQCAPSCELETCGGGACPARRDDLAFISNGANVSADATPLPWLGRANHGLEKRLFTISMPYDKPDRGGYKESKIREYVSRQLTEESNLRDKTWPPTQPFSAGDEGALARDFVFEGNGPDAPFRGGKAQIGSEGLMGCTMITIVSEKAVWAAHFWESYSNGRDLESEGQKAPVGGWPTRDDPDTDIAWQERVVSVLQGKSVRRPATNDKGPYIKPYGAYGNGAVSNSPGSASPTYKNFRDAGNCFVFMMAPTPKREPVLDPNGEGYTIPNFRYPNKMARLVEIFKGLLPQCMIIQKAYLAVGSPDDPELIGRKTGTHLFQWDPDHDGEGNAGWRLFLDNVPFEYPAGVDELLRLSRAAG